MRTTPLFLALALAACAGGTDEGTDDDTDDTDATDTDDGDTDAGSSDEALVGCVVVSTETVTDLDAVPEGFAESVEALLLAAEGVFSGDLALQAGGTVGTSFVVTRTGDVVVERRDWADDGGQEIEGDPEPALATDTAEPGSGGGEEPGDPPTDTGLVEGDGCPDGIRFAATVDLTAGTALDETFTVDVRVDTASVGQLWADVAFDTLVGDATPAGFDPADMAEVSLQLFATHTTTATWTLDLSFVGVSAPSGTGDDEVVSATNDPYASGELTRVID